jgi:hypothetical protein
VDVVHTGVLLCVYVRWRRISRLFVWSQIMVLCVYTGGGVSRDSCRPVGRFSCGPVLFAVV